MVAECSVGLRLPLVLDAANAWGLPQLSGGPEWSVATCIAIATAMAGLPDPDACAREISWAWAVEGTGTAAASFRETITDELNYMWHLAVDKGGEMCLCLPREKEDWSPLQAATYVGGALRGQLLLPLVDTPSPFCLPQLGRAGTTAVPSSPSGRSRRSAGGCTRMSVLEGAPPPEGARSPRPGASPRRQQAKRQGEVSIEDIDQLTPCSLRVVAKRLCAERAAAAANAPPSPVSLMSRRAVPVAREEGQQVAGSGGGSLGVTSIPPFPSLQSPFGAAAGSLDDEGREWGAPPPAPHQRHHGCASRE